MQFATSVAITNINLPAELLGHCTQSCGRSSIQLQFPRHPQLKCHRFPDMNSCLWQFKCRKPTHQPLCVVLATYSYIHRVTRQNARRVQLHQFSVQYSHNQEMYKRWCSGGKVRTLGTTDRPSFERQEQRNSSIKWSHFRSPPNYIHALPCWATSSTSSSLNE